MQLEELEKESQMPEEKRELLRQPRHQLPQKVFLVQ